MVSVTALENQTIVKEEVLIFQNLDRLSLERLCVC